MASAQQYRYPGARPFETEQRYLFFGRENDIEDFHRLIRLESLVVLYGKSGLGKSSLLNAGVVPKVLEEGRFDAIRVRFGAWRQGRNDNPTDITRESISINTPPGDWLAKMVETDHSIWRKVKEHQVAQQGKKGLLLVFDQFEELFTFPKETIFAFRRQLAEALYSSVPERYIEALEQQIQQDQHALSDEALQLLQTPPAFKVVMAIRSDRMHLLDQLSDYLPSILKKCYELAPLNNIQAEAAIRKPASIHSADLTTPPFEYDTDALRKILNFLTKEGNQRIESFQLQILCQSVEKKVRYENQCIQADDLGDVESVYENYYEDQLNLLKNDNDRQAARLLIEDGLIFEEEERRLSLYEGQIYKAYGLSQEGLRLLVDSHLLRSEPSLQGEGYTYELSHDSLVGPVLRAKVRRKEEEARLIAAQEKIARERELEEVRRQAEEERQQAEQERHLRQLAQRNSRLALLVSFVAIALAIAAALSFFAARKNAQMAKNTLQDLLSTQAERDLKDYNLLLQRGDDLQTTGYPNAARELYLQAQKLVDTHRTMQSFKGKAAEIEERLNRLQTKN